MVLIKLFKVICGDLIFFLWFRINEIIVYYLVFNFLYIIEGMKIIEKNVLIGLVNIFDKVMIYMIYVYMFELYYYY